MRLDYNKFGVFGARRANVTGWEHESPCLRFRIAKIRRQAQRQQGRHPVDVGQEEAAFSAASFALASALAAVRAARSECHAAVIYCVNRPNGSASSFVSGL